MDEATCEAYKRAGAVETTLEEWLGLTEVDIEVIELSLRVGREIRRRRAASGMTPEEFAAKHGTTPRILNRIENGVESSFNRMLNLYFASGAKLDDLVARPQVASPA